MLKSRHYILMVLARRGFVFREGTNGCTPHLKWLQHLTTDGSPLAPHDRLVFRGYHALRLNTLQCRDALDGQCLRGISFHSATALATEIVDGRRFERPAARVLSWARLTRRLERRSDATRLYHDRPASRRPSSRTRGRRRAL